MAQFNSALDKLPRTSFNALEFPCAHHRIHAIQRKHVHEYPHRPGGSPEKLGRSLYTVTVRGVFHDTLEAYPDLYPRTINDLQVLFENGTTAQFVHPSVGSFPAFISSWDRSSDPRSRSGELVEIELTEDQTTNFLTTSILDSAHFAALGSTADEVAAQLASLQAQLVPNPDQSTTVNLPASAIAAQVNFTQSDTNLFDAIQSLANDITGIGDTAELYGNLLQAKADQMANVCAQIDSSLSLQDPRSFLLMDSLHDLWALALRIQQDSQQQRVQLQTWNVTMTMPITAVSAAIYNGDASHAEDLLSLNDIPNPLAVRAGTTLNYYPA
jgi:hypothetical protein